MYPGSHRGSRRLQYPYHCQSRPFINSSGVDSYPSRCIWRSCLKQWEIVLTARCRYLKPSLDNRVDGGARCAERTPSTIPNGVSVSDMALRRWFEEGCCKYLYTLTGAPAIARDIGDGWIYKPPLSVRLLDKFRVKAQPSPTQFTKGLFRERQQISQTAIIPDQYVHITKGLPTHTGGRPHQLPTYIGTQTRHRYVLFTRDSHL